MFFGKVVHEIYLTRTLQGLRPWAWTAAQIFIFGVITTLQVLVSY
jgi:hypothetical protein